MVRNVWRVQQTMLHRDEYWANDLLDVVKVIYFIYYTYLAFSYFWYALGRWVDDIMPA